MMRRSAITVVSGLLVGAVLLLAVGACSSPAKDIEPKSSVPVPLGVLENAFGYSGEYPQPASVSYTPRNEQPWTVRAFPGQVEVFFDTTVSMDAAQSAIKSNKGTVLAQIPLLGYYLAGVAAGSEGHSRN